MSTRAPPLAPLLLVAGLGALLGAGTRPRPAPPRFSEPSSGEVVGPACELVAGRRLLLDVLQPCLGGWAGEPLVALEPGTLHLRAPAPGGEALELVARRGGWAVSRRWSWVELHARAARRGLAAARLAQAPALRREHAAAWGPLEGWLPELVTGPLPAEQRRQLLHAWEGWAAWRAWLDREGASPLPGEWDPGLRLLGAPAATPPPGPPLELRPLGIQEDPERRRTLALVVPEAKVSPFDAVAEAARRIELRWPEVPGEGAWLRVVLRARRIPEGTTLALREEGGTPVVRFWPPPRPALEEAWARRGPRWWAARLPRDLAPAPGTRLVLELQPTHRHTLSAARLVSLHVVGEGPTSRRD